MTCRLAQISFVLAGLLVVASCYGCATPPRRSVSLAPGWVEADSATVSEVRKLFSSRVATVLSVWHSSGDVIAVLLLRQPSPIREGWTMVVRRDPRSVATMRIIEVDGDSAIGIVNSPRSRPLPAA